MTDNGNNLVMPVAPYYGGGYNGGGNNLFGGDGWWIILLLLICGGWGNGFGSGFGGNGGMFPWIMNGQATGVSDVQRGFDQAAVINGINGVQSAVTSGFGDVQTALCGGFGGVNAAIANGFAQAEIAANSRQMANMNQNFAMQSALQSCCCENRAGLADLKYTVATENCADRTQSLMNTRDIIESQTRGTQAIIDKLCALELDGVKSQLAAAQRENVGLQNQLNMANLAASQATQTVNIRDSIIDELRSCPIPSQPVYGSQPIFTCGGNAVGCGCGG